MLRPSFVPARPQRELVRYRRKLIEERSRAYNRLEKVLEGANIKLTAVASTITGTSVCQMLWALIEGQEDLEQIAELAKGPLRRKRAELVEALESLLRRGSPPGARRTRAYRHSTAARAAARSGPRWRWDIRCW